MCGIFGYIGKIERPLAERCLNTMTHRGPDGWGIWANDGILLGHRRLSILDVSENGKQPMSYGNGRYWITFNGEVYNFLEIRSELEAKGHTFVSESDTEVILAAYMVWGEDCLFKFNGMWAFAIWDTAERTLFLCRDRFGKKPLFYAELPNGDFAFASEMKALLPLLTNPAPNHKLVTNMTLRSSFAFEATEECSIQGIKRLLAGHSGYLRAGRPQSKRWWNTLDHLPEVPSNYEAQVEMLRELLEDACRLRMRSDVPIGTALSGGLDSSAVFSLLGHISRTHGGENRLSSNWQHAFVASFPETPLDEAHFAEQVATYQGVKADILDIDPTPEIDNLKQMLYLYEDVAITCPIPFMALYRRIKQSGVTVTLDGHAADELFGGYHTDFSYALMDAGTNVGQINQILDVYDGISDWSSAQFKRPASRILSYAKNIGSALYKTASGMQTNLGGEFTTHPRWKEMDHMSRALFWQTHCFVLPTLLRSYDRYSMANSVEIRMPFLDWRVATFAFALPWTSKLQRGYSKVIIRDAMAPYMPRDIAYRRTKIGFNAPMVNWMRGPMRSFFMDTINSQAFQQCDLVNTKHATKLVNHVMDDSKATFKSGESAWSSVMPYLWSEAMFNRPKD